MWGAIIAGSVNAYSNVSGVVPPTPPVTRSFRKPKPSQRLFSLPNQTFVWWQNMAGCGLLTALALSLGWVLLF